MHMQLSKTHNFFFHPLAENHTPARKACSILSIIALSIVTVGGFLVAFGIVNLRDRNIQAKKGPVKVTQAFMKSHSLAQAATQQNQYSPKLQNLIEQHAQQLAIFEIWAQNNNWEKFAKAHYDWWMFPINRGSQGQGATYQVSSEEVAQLKADPVFMSKYRRGVELVVQSWGWDLTQKKLIAPSKPGQQWTGYGVRLGKIADSLILFGEKDLYRNVQLFYQNVCKPRGGLEAWVSKACSRNI